MTTTRKIIAVAAALAAGVAALTLTPNAEATVTRPAADIVWAPCPGNPAVQCGDLTVPLDWAAPGGETVDIAVARRPAADPEKRVGTLIYLPAGPGSSGVRFVADDTYFPMLFTAPVAERFDVIGIDPRGVGGSEAIMCDAALTAPIETLTPGDPAAFEARKAANAALYEDCARRSGPLFDHMSSVDTARDVDALRAALGERTVNLYGLSYGTLAGQMYAELYPKRIRTAVLDANMDHSMGTRDLAVTAAAGAQAAFEQFTAWCERETTCAVHGRDVPALVADLYARAEAGELGDTTPASLIDAIVSPLSRPDLAAAGEAIAAFADGSPSSGQPAKAAETLTPLPISLYCSDHASDISGHDDLLAAWQASEEVATDVHFAPLGWGMTQTCLNWPAAMGNPRHELSVEGAAPIMVMGSRYDTQTPYEWSARVAAQIDDAVLVTYDGLGHGSYQRTDCTRAAVEGYLIEGRAPARDLVCPAAATG